MESTLATLGIFFLGIFYSLFVSFARQKFFQHKKNNQDLLPLWHSWIFASLLRVLGLILGYSLISWWMRAEDHSHSFMTQIVLAYTSPFFIWVLIDLAKIVRGKHSNSS